MSSDDWPVVRLGDLVDIKHGFAFQGQHFRDHPTSDVLLTPGNFGTGGGFRGDKLKYYDGPVPEEFILSAGDLLVTMTDLSKEAGTLGYPALVPSSRRHRFLHNQRLGRVTVREGVSLDPEYAYYVLCSPEYRAEILAGATGTTVKHTSPSRIGAFRFRLPPLSEQHRIARTLGALDDKIELNRRLSRTLESIARAMFKSWFVDFDPVLRKAEGGEPGLPPDLAALFRSDFVMSSVGPIPRGWRVKPLDQIAKFLNGVALQRFPPTGDNDLPAIKGAELTRGITASTGRASRDLPSEYIVRQGDVLFSWSGSLNCVVWSGSEGALNQHVFKVISADFPAWFVFHWIQKHLPTFRDIAADKATTMGHIKRTHLNDASVAVPTSEVLAAADAIMSPIESRKVIAGAESPRLENMRRMLLNGLVDGHGLASSEGV